MPVRLAIFDLDGTLYRFGDSEDFSGSWLRAEVRANAVSFISKRLGIGGADAEGVWDELSLKYNSDISIGVEREYGIDRGDYFYSVWNIDASKYIPYDPALPEALSRIACEKALLSNAPQVWIRNVLGRLGIGGIFRGIWSGEGDVRKPSALAYSRILDCTGVDREEAIVVDDETKYLRGAKDFGLRTVLVGRGQAGKPAGADFMIGSVKELGSIALW